MDAGCAQGKGITWDEGSSRRGLSCELPAATTPDSRGRSGLGLEEELGSIAQNALPGCLLVFHLSTEVGD